jgi:glycosyltransferase involved in cell wall biosynthesis
VVVDDFSDKDPYEDIKDLPIRFLRHDKNRGLAQTRNMAIANTKSEYILPLDADDELYPNVIDKMLEQVADIVYGNLVWRDNGIQLKPTTEVNYEKLLVNNQIFGSSLYKRSLWKLIGGYWEEYKEFYEDWDFWARCAREGAKFHYIDLDIYKYGGTTGGMCYRLGERRNYNVDLIKEHIK